MFDEASREKTTVENPVARAVSPGRLTILVTSTQRRGAEVFGEHLSRGLAGRGWTIEFIALGAASDNSATIDAESLSDSMVGRLAPKVVWRLRSRLAKSSPDVVLANGSSTLQYSVATVRTLRNRPKLAYSSIGEPSYWANTPRKKVAYRSLLALVDRVFSVSAPTAAQLTEEFGVSTNRIGVLPTGVPAEFFAIERGPSDGRLNILFLGSLSDEKDPMAAIGTLEKLPTDTEATLRMVGGGPLAAKLQAIARSIRAPHRLELTGSVEDIRPHLAWADVLLLTSRTEGLPAAILEASAAAIPTVAFEVGGVAEAVHNGKTGQLVAPGDIAGAAAALSKYAVDSNYRTTHGTAARALAESSFTMDAAMSRYDQALRELVRGHAEQ